MNKSGWYFGWIDMKGPNSLRHDIVDCIHTATIQNWHMNAFYVKWEANAIRRAERQNRLQQMPWAHATKWQTTIDDHMPTYQKLMLYMRTAKRWGKIGGQHAKMPKNVAATCNCWGVLKFISADSTLSDATMASSGYYIIYDNASEIAEKWRSWKLHAHAASGTVCEYAL